jgi:regulator of replication initiation timing
MKTQCIALLLAFGLAGAARNSGATEATPIEKVISLLEDLIDTVTEEGKEDAKTYDEASCFCKDNTGEKSKAIKEHQLEIDEQSGAIEENTAGLEDKKTELSGLIKQIEELTSFMADARTERKKDAVQAQAVIADLTKACDSLAGAIKSLEGSKPELLQVKRSIRKALALADALDLKVSPKKRRAVNVLLQMDDQQPAPEGDYEFHSDEIISLLKDLEVDFNEDRKSNIDEEEKAQEAHDKLMTEKEAAKDDAEAAKSDAEEAIADHEAAIAEAKEALVGANNQLTDDQAFLEDLTGQCELKANEFDKRSTSRAGELTALKKALEIIKGAAGKEAARLIQEDNAAPSTEVENENFKWQVAVQKHENPGVAFLQTVQQTSLESTRKTVVEFLQKSNAEDATGMEQRKQLALNTLAQEGRRLNNAMLVATALHLSGDPFAKVKELIQKLIEKLLQQMADEAGQKGFCDTELGKAKTSRDFEHEKTVKLNADLDKLEVKKEQLMEEIDTLTTDLDDLDKALTKSTEERAAEKEENQQTIKDSSEGLAAVKDAMAVLKDFYGQAAKEGMGKQESAGGIFAMLEVIIADFTRSIETTTEAEKEALRVFVDFDRATKGSISQKSTQKTLAEEDLATTEMAIKDAMADLQASQDMVDDAVKALEELNPACIDTGMTYAERVAAREAEIKALKKALCQLDPEGVEESC